MVARASSNPCSLFGRADPNTQTQKRSACRQSDVEEKLNIGNSVPTQLRWTHAPVWFNVETERMEARPSSNPCNAFDLFSVELIQALCCAAAIINWSCNLIKMIEIIAAIYTGTDFAVGGADPEARKTEHGAVDHFSSGRQQHCWTVICRWTIISQRALRSL